MECPLCHQPMRITRKDTSAKKDQSQTYDRTTHTCEQDDVWAVVEIPQQTTTSSNQSRLIED